MPPTKPQACIVGDRIGWFMGADYKLMTLGEAYAAAELLKSLADELRLQEAA